MVDYLTEYEAIFNSDLWDSKAPKILPVGLSVSILYLVYPPKCSISEWVPNYLVKKSDTLTPIFSNKTNSARY